MAPDKETAAEYTARVFAREDEALTLIIRGAAGVDAATAKRLGY